MSRKNSFLVLLCAGALVLAPVMTPEFSLLPDTGGKAYAKNGNGGGNGNGNGNGGGGNGNGNGNANGGGNGFGGNSKKTGNASRANGNGGFGIFNNRNNKVQARKNNNNSNGLKGFIGNVFGNKTGNGNRKVSRGNSSNSGYRLPKAERASLSNVASTPARRPDLKEKNLNARLGRLNSLKRSYNAYLNSNDPHLASVKEFIGATIEYQKAAESLEALADELAQARDRLAGVLEESELPDDFDKLTSEEISEQIAAEIKSLEDKIAELEGATNPDGSFPNEEEIAALKDQIDGLNEFIESPEFKEFSEAEGAFGTAEDKVAELQDSVSDEALRDALSEMINENRADDVDDEMVDWAKSVLDGKIEEIRNATENPDGTGLPDIAPEEDAALEPGLAPTEEDLRLTQVN